MKHKKNFNGLLESLLMTVLMSVVITMDFLFVWFAVVNPREGTNPIAALIIGALFFGTLTIIGVVLFVTRSYEYWELSDDSISTKRLLQKKKSIKLSEILKVEKKEVLAPILFLCSYDAYVVSSRTNTIMILLKENKRYDDLDSVLAPFLQ